MLELSLILVLVVIFTLAFDYINGFHDTANAIATVVSTRVLSPRSAIIMAAGLNFLGALFSTHVAVTIAGGLVDTARFQIVDLHQPAALVAKLKTPQEPVSRYVAEHLSPATRQLLQASTPEIAPSEELQTALVNDFNRILTRADLYSAERFQGITLKPDTVKKAEEAKDLKPEKLANLNRTLLEKAFPHELDSGVDAFQLVILAAIIGAIVWNLITWKYGIPSSSSHALIGGLVGAAVIHGGLEAVLWQGIVKKVLIPLVGSPSMGFLLGFLLMGFIFKTLAHVHPGRVSATFRHLQIFSAAAMAFTHGLNDAQKSMGIITMALVSARLIPEPVVPTWVVFSCATVMALGTSVGGWRIIKTMGHKIIRLEPVHGFAAETSSAIVLFITSHFGMPVSTTHVISGCIFGVGASKRLTAVRWGVAQSMVMAWVLTLPAAALVAALSYELFMLVGLGR
ncbi:MAG TPA: inorganic phosphate transporter [Desulfurivibrionaceae bacterium]|nr:inorganic phosphate transporter [Desulfurivibrionaceae bacterium]